MRQPRNRIHFAPEVLIIAFFAIVKVLIHLLLPEYGYHRDEMYYVAIADGFSFSNLDMPPGSPLYLKLFLVLFGHSLKVVHLAAAVCGAIVIVFGMLIAKELGGKRYALILTGTFLLFSGLIIFGSLYSYDDPSFVVWAAVFYLLVRMLNGSDQRLWLAAGLLMGIGMLTKLTILFLGFSLFVSLWLVPQRGWYKRPWIWIAGVIALACAVPYMLWQSSHDWYFLSYAASYSGRTTHTSPVLDFLWNQLLPNNPAMFPVWAIGLGMLLFGRQWKLYRILGYVYIVLCVTLFFLGGQFYFMLPIYAVLVAAGSVRIEQWLEPHVDATRGRLVPKIAIPVAYVLLSLPMLPFVVPVLPPDQLIAYLRPVGVNAGVKTEDRHITNLPQHMADRFGWDEMAREVAAVYHEVQGTSADPVGVTTGNWGEASAIHLHRKELGLPEPITGDGWFYFEAFRNQTYPLRYVSIGVPASQLNSLFEHVEQKGLFTHPYCMPDENNNPIYYCAAPRIDLRKYWVVNYRMDTAFTGVMRRAGVSRAVEYFHDRRRQDSSCVLFAERQMNSLGYQYLNRHQVKEALALFKLNVEAYPWSPNVYDSYGEALIADHQIQLAVENYTRSVEMNPGNDVGKKKLEELRVAMGRLKESPRQDEQRLHWWREARFGMFIHWGPISLKGTEISWSRGGERRGIEGKGEVPVEVYDNLYKEFNPVKFNADTWVSIAKGAGMKYMVLTAKHCDGFCLWHSRIDDYSIANSPFKRDVCRELSSAAQKAGMKIGWYYSPMDWRDQDCRTERNEVYVKKMQGHLRELLGNYGRIALLWFDTDAGPAPWDQANTYALVRTLQPGIIINNRLDMGTRQDYENQDILPNADYATPEQRVGAFDDQHPWETCMTIGTQWSWKPNDTVKTAGECIKILTQCVTGDGNLLLNVGPMPNGEIEPRQVAVLKQVGAWLKQYGESIYGTRGGPFRNGEWGGATRKGSVVYLHILKWTDGQVVLPKLEARIKKSKVLTGGRVEVKQTKDETLVMAPPGTRPDPHVIVKLELDKNITSSR